MESLFQTLQCSYIITWSEAVVSCMGNLQSSSVLFNPARKDVKT